MKTTRPLSRAERAGEALSKVRAEMSVRGVKTFKLKELIEDLKNHNCPFPGQVGSTLKELNAIVPVSYGVYMFKTSEPVYVLRQFEDTLDRKCKPMLKKVTTRPGITEEVAINYLKQKGYRIYRVVTTTEEI